jgi:hypothetical protein
VRGGGPVASGVALRHSATAESSLAEPEGWYDHAPLARSWARSCRSAPIRRLPVRRAADAASVADHLRIAPPERARHAAVAWSAYDAEVAGLRSASPGRAWSGGRAGCSGGAEPLCWPARPFAQPGYSWRSCREVIFDPALHARIVGR